MHRGCIIGNRNAVVGIVPVIRTVGKKGKLNLYAFIYTSIFWGVWHLPILISGLYMPGTPAWYSVPAFLFMIIPVGMIYGIITIKTKSIWPAIFLHAAHNTFDQLIFGTVTVANNKMFFVSETGIFTIIFAWIVAVFLYKKCND